MNPFADLLRMDPTHALEATKKAFDESKNLPRCAQEDQAFLKLRFAIIAFTKEKGNDDFPIGQNEIRKAFTANGPLMDYSASNIARMADKILAQTSFANDYVESQQ